MRARTSFITAAAFVLLLLALVGEVTIGPKAQSQQPVRKVDMGDYEPVVPWPQPLPDTDLAHAGWTWGIGRRRLGRKPGQSLGRAARRDRAPPGR